VSQIIFVWVFLGGSQQKMKAWQVSPGLCCALQECYRWLLLQEKNEGNVTNAALLQTAHPGRRSALLVPMFPVLVNRAECQPAECISQPLFASLLWLWALYTS